MKGEDREGARGVGDEIKAAGVRCDVVTYNSLLQLYVKGEDMEGARRAVEGREAAGFRSRGSTYN